MSRARDLSKFGNINSIAVDTTDTEVGIASTVPSSTLDVRGEVKVGTAVQLGSAGVITATSFSGSGANLTGIAGVGVTATVVSVATTTGLLNVTGTTDSTSSTTGSVTIAGGVGIAKNVFIGAGLSVAGTLTYEDVTSVDSVGLITAKSGVNITGGELTVGSGITMGIAGVATFSGTSDVHLLDNVQLKIGDGSDFTITHDGTQSKIIDAGSGTLHIQNSLGNIDFASHGSGVQLQINKSGIKNTGITTTVQLDVSSNLTVGSGITFGSAGVATFSGTSDVHIVDNVQLNFGNAKEGDIYRDSVQMIINNDSGNLKVRSASVHIAGLSNEKHIVSNTGVGVTLFHNNSAKFETVSTGCSVYGNLATNGDFTITGDSTNSIQLRVVPNEKNLVAIANGATELYYNNSKKFETTNDGTVTTGIATATGGLAINADNKNLSMGASEDFKLFHDGDHSIIHDDGTGGLKFVSNHSFQFRDTNKDSGDYCINANIDGAVSLYYNGSNKFETTNDGTVTTGIATATGGLEINADSKFLKIGASGDLSLYHASGQSKIVNTTGSLWLQSDTGIRFTDAGLNQSMAAFYDNAQCELFYNGNKKFETTNDGTVTTGIATVSQGMHFQGMLREDVNIVANKLSAASNINLEDGMVHYFSTNETGSGTPNIRWNSSFSLNNKMSTGEVVTVTIIYKPNGAGYYPDMTIDGSNVTEEWNGGSAPSSANAGGFDVLTNTLVKTGSGSFIVLSNVQNYA